MPTRGRAAIIGNNTAGTEASCVTHDVVYPIERSVCKDFLSDMFSIEHTILWFRIFPGLEESGVLPDVISLFLFPFFDFALITYILLTVIFMFKTRKPAPRDG